MILVTVDQLRLVADTPSSCAMKLFGKPKNPFCLGRLTMNTSRLLIATGSSASLDETSGMAA
jgi:hypothetical protein